MYRQPTGSMILAEMKRMFVLPKFQCSGIDNILIIKFLAQAKKLGYSSVKLDTIQELDRAFSL